MDIDEYTSDEIINALASGDVSLSRFAGHDILDEKGETVYRDFWGFSGAIEEEARPDGGNNILDVVNQTPQLNGKLSEVYAQLGASCQIFIMISSLIRTVQNGQREYKLCLYFC